VVFKSPAWVPDGFGPGCGLLREPGFQSADKKPVWLSSSYLGYSGMQFKSIDQLVQPTIILSHTGFVSPLKIRNFQLKVKIKGCREHPFRPSFTSHSF
jgi:hypothetical protein